MHSLNHIVLARTNAKADPRPRPRIRVVAPRRPFRPPARGR